MVHFLDQVSSPSQRAELAMTLCKEASDDGPEEVGRLY